MRYLPTRTPNEYTRRHDLNMFIGNETYHGAMTTQSILHGSKLPGLCRLLCTKDQPRDLSSPTIELPLSASVPLFADDGGIYSAMAS
jgi:hypothetical protein